MKRNIKKISLLMCAVMLVCAFLPACSSHKDENNISETDIVLSAGGHDISYGLYRYFFLNYKANYTKQELADDEAGVYAEIEKAVMESLEGMYAVIALCSEHGISVDDPSIKADVDITINNIKEQYTGDDDKTGERGFEKDLKANFMTEHVLRLVSAVDACEIKLKAKLIEEGKIINDEQILKDAVEGDEFIRVVQIYINSENGASRDENKALADTVFAKASGGADFDALIGSYSNDYSMTKDGYYICRGFMNESFEAAAFALEVGEISSVLELEDGFHIIKRLPKDAQYMEKNLDELKERYQDCIFYDMIAKKAQDITISKKDRFSEIQPSLISLD